MEDIMVIFEIYMQWVSSRGNVFCQLAKFEFDLEVVPQKMVQKISLHLLR